MMSDKHEAVIRKVGLRVAVLALLTLGGAGCGAAAMGSSQGPTGTMEEIYQLQSEIETHHDAIMAGGGECHDQCRASSSICDSAARICEVASELAEMEALQSCRRAEAICIEARRRVAESCTCPD